MTTPTLTDNEIGYRIYCWDRKGYGFIPNKYDPNHDYTGYLRYYQSDAMNQILIKTLANKGA